MWNEHPDIVQDWNVFGWKIDYCLVSHAERNKTCAVKYSFPILIGQSPKARYTRAIN